jgi:RhtB (resistance to homoserine/threonine) family protein
MQEFLLVAGVHLLAVMSPGPDFAMVMRNSLVYSRRTGVLAAVGLGLGILLHITYSLLGIGLIISQSVLLFNAIKLLGAAYLIYIGTKSLLAKRTPHGEQTADYQPAQKDLSTLQAIRLGFLTNALNPKATLFFLALFTQVINPGTSLGIKLLYGAEMSVATFAWFSAVALVLTHRRINQAFSGIKHYLEKAFGAILIGLGIKVALGPQK